MCVCGYLLSLALLWYKERNTGNELKIFINSLMIVIQYEIFSCV